MPITAADHTEIAVAIGVQILEKQREKEQNDILRKEIAQLKEQLSKCKCEANNESKKTD